MTTPEVTFTTEQQQLLQIQYLKTRLRNCTSWFYWIAGLSILNTVTSLFGLTITFVIGLGATQVVDAISNMLANDFGGENSGIIFRGAGLFVNLILAGIIALFGFLSIKGKRWALITGMVVYLADATLLLIFQDWLGVLFHGWALFSLFKGISIMKSMSNLESAKNIQAIPVI